MGANILEGNFYRGAKNTIYIDPYIDGAVVDLTTYSQLKFLCGDMDDVLVFSKDKVAGITIVDGDAVNSRAKIVSERADSLAMQEGMFYQWSLWDPSTDTLLGEGLLYVSAALDHAAV